jgi:hypothetical protein
VFGDENAALLRCEWYEGITLVILVENYLDNMLSIGYGNLVGLEFVNPENKY